MEKINTKEVPNEPGIYVFKDKYEELMKQMPENIDWSKLAEFEKGIDTTSGSKELACTAGVCEVVDIVAT